MGETSDQSTCATTANMHARHQCAKCNSAGSHLLTLAVGRTSDRHLRATERAISSNKLGHMCIPVSAKVTE
eukprot:4990340-Alexandrium_andersonii.AAC.1